MQDNDTAAWRSQLRKGSLELAVLLLLRAERRYGLQMVELLNQAGLGISEGSIYPLLSRLKAEKKVSTQWVEEEQGHAHKYYQLTERGRSSCHALMAAWREYVSALEKIAGNR
jgi:PadR family transcriptional regulator, regulatory protein PadR